MDVVEHLRRDDGVELLVVVERARVEHAPLDPSTRGGGRLRVDADHLGPLGERGPEREVAAPDVEHATGPPLEQVEQQPDLRANCPGSLR